MSLRVLVAPSGLKEALTAEEVAEVITRGVRGAAPDAVVVSTPVPDGGEGFARGLVGAVGGALHPVEVTGPLGAPVTARFGVLDVEGERTAALAMSSAAGLHLLPTDHREPLATTTRGVGELVLAALDAGARRLVVGCGDSGTSDGGAGMAQALGARLVDADGRDLGPGGGALADLDHIDASGLDPRLAEVDIEVAVNPTTPMTGPSGVARVFGPQKGAGPDEVATLAAGLERWAGELERLSGRDVAHEPGAGASGGLGACLAALLGARLVPRFEVIGHYLDLDRLIARSDLVLTAEGSLDGQSTNGKVPGDLARRAAALDVPLIALAGRVEDGARDLLGEGLQAWISALVRPCTLEEALSEARTAFEAAAEQTVRTVLVGRRIAESGSDRR